LFQLHAHEFNTNVSLKELYDFAVKYNDQVSTVDKLNQPCSTGSEEKKRDAMGSKIAIFTSTIQLFSIPSWIWEKGC